MVNKNLACFYTGGYTEASGSMGVFLKKINPSFEYTQCIPNATKKRKGLDKNILDEYSGLTGTKLLDKVYEILAKPYMKKRFKEGLYYGVLIEDDLDGRYDKLSDEELLNKEAEIKSKIHNVVECIVPIFFVYASPEAESWFVSDWANGFGKFFSEDISFREFDAGVRKKFSIDIQKNIIKTLLNDDLDSIELYASINSEYVKLSEELIELIFRENIALIQRLGLEKKNFKGFYYSKREHGPLMLKSIDPDIVRQHCNRFFLKNLLSLRNAVV